MLRRCGGLLIHPSTSVFTGSAYPFSYPTFSPVDIANEALALRFSVPAEHWSIEISDPWSTPEAGLAPSAGTPVLFAVDLLDIPEETHGRWIRHTLSAGVRPLGLLGFEARLALRYGEGSERLERRRSLWQTFAQAEGLQYLQPHDILSPSA